MAKTHRVFNVSRGIRLKLKQAETAVDVCAAVWVVFGVSIRDVSVAEAIALRNRRAAGLERLEYAELPGLVYEPRAGAMESHRREQHLARCATVFCRQQQAQ